MNLRAALALALTIGLAACATVSRQPVPDFPVPEAPPVATPTPRPAPACADCGRVLRIETVQAVRATSSGGAVLGGVVGGVVSGEARPAAKPAGPPKSSYRLTLAMGNGRRLVIHQNLISANLRVGSLVRVDHGRVVLLR